MDVRSFFYEFGKHLYHIDRIYCGYAKKSNVSDNLLWILYALNDDLPHSQKDICIDWDLPKSTVNTIILDLKKDNYVEFEHVEGTRREMYVRLTKKGKEFAIQALKPLYEDEEKIFSALKLNKEEFLSSLNEIEEVMKKI